MPSAYAPLQPRHLAHGTAPPHNQLTFAQGSKHMPEAAKMTRIFISGGGPVGLAAALELRRRGYEPQIVDPDLEVSPQSRALAINARTLELLEPSGATEMLLAAGHRLHGAILRSSSRTLAQIDLSRIPHRFNFLLSLAQSRTEQILEAVLHRLGGHVQRGVALASFAEEAEIRVALSDGRQDSCDMLIGADGAHSTVRKALGLGFPGESAEQIFGLADVELDAWPFPFDRAVAFFLDTHVAAFIPMREGFGRFITTRPGCVANLPREAKVQRCEWEADFRISYRQVEAYQRGNVFLAGDAAHIHSPVGGRGMNLGIEDACWLAWLIDEARTEDYTRLRQPVGARVLRLTERPTSAISASSGVMKLLLRTVVPFFLSIPAMQRRAMPVFGGLDTPHPPWI
jgi:2-polyprenyl-6-methoxyphenol hydroxylase-like FAD-dependent oxidoreductase